MRAAQGALEREHAGREQLARLRVRRQLLERDLETRIARHPQAVDMRFDPLVQTREVAERVVRRVDCGIAQEPEEGRLLGVLLDDVAQDAGHARRLSSAAPSRP